MRSQSRKIRSAIRARASDPRIGVVYRPIGELKLEPRNPRAHSTRQIRQIARSIETFSFCVPVLVDATLKVVAGHGRVAAARVLGLNEVPTIRLEHLSEAQARAFMIADNRLTENSTWDDHLLAEQLQELSLMELDFSLEATGFEMAEIDLRIEGLSSEPGGDDPADAIPTWRSVGAWTSSDPLRQRARRRRICGADAGHHGGGDNCRPTVQRSHRRQCHRPGLASPSRVRDGRGRNERAGVHRLSKSGLHVVGPQ